MILLIDNYDSFVHNLARYFVRLGHDTRVVRNDAIDAAGARAMNPRAIVLSPGPCGPSEAGCSLEIVRELHRDYPILGVCLGHQTIGQAFGGSVVRAPRPMHGRASQIRHDGRGLFASLPNPLRVGRYHSLVVAENSLPACLQATAHTADGVVMALSHREHPTFGVQFHPESILTERGYDLLANFLELAGLGRPQTMPEVDDAAIAPPAEMPAEPAPTTLTFLM